MEDISKRARPPSYIIKQLWPLPFTDQGQLYDKFLITHICNGMFKPILIWINPELCNQGHKKSKRLKDSNILINFWKLNTSSQSGLVMGNLWKCPNVLVYIVAHMHLVISWNLYIRRLNLDLVWFNHTTITLNSMIAATETDWNLTAFTHLQNAIQENQGPLLFLLS